MSLYFRVVAKEVGDGSSDETWQKLEEAAKLVFENEERLTKIEKEEEFANGVRAVVKLLRNEISIMNAYKAPYYGPSFFANDIVDVINKIEYRLLGL